VFAPDQQRLTALIQLRTGVGDSFHEVFARSVLDVVNLADRIARGKAAAERRRHEQVADFHIRIAGQKWQLQTLAVTKTERDGLQAGAIDFNWNAVIRIGDQQRLRSAGTYFNHLAHDASRVDQGLTTIDLVVAAFVERNLVTIRVLADRDDFSNEDVIGQIL
jgi:hypothetical protein